MPPDLHVPWLLCTQAKINQKMVAVDAFLNHRHVPDTLKKKVQGHYTSWQ
jgi:hypothetical protein